MGLAYLEINFQGDSMKKLFAISISVAFVATGILFAEAAPAPVKQCKMECKAENKSKLDTCLATAKALPKGKDRKQAIKACMKDYKQAFRACKKDCKKGSDPQPCLDACSGSLSDATASCNATFDPASCPPGDAECTGQVTAARDVCLADATQAFSNCQALCQ